MSKEKDLKSINNKKYVNENLYVVDSKMLESINGFSKDTKILKQINEKHSYVDRNVAENNGAYKQIVVNVLLVCKEGQNLKFGVLQRNNKYTETSLNSTIGMVGGHVNDEDVSIKDALIREVTEEINIDKDFALNNFKEFGIINNNGTNSISDYHTGYISILNVDSYDNIDSLKSKESNQRLIWVKIPFGDSEVLKQLKDCTYPRFQLMDKWLQYTIVEFMTCYVK